MGWEDVVRRGRGGRPVPASSTYEDPGARSFRRIAPVAPVAPVVAPTLQGGVDYVAIQKQADAQLAASNQQLALMQQQAANQEAQFKSLLALEQQRTTKLEASAIEQATLFAALKLEQDSALALQEKRLARSQAQAQEQQQGLFRLGERTASLGMARSTARRTQIGARANVFRG